jgi:uncharacterized protein YjiS (DUF1127 family)
MVALVRYTLTNYQPFPALPRAARPAPGLLQRMSKTLRLWQRRLRERRELAGLTLHDLRDIGTTPSEVWNELRQPVWRSTLRR